MIKKDRIEYVFFTKIAPKLNQKHHNYKSYNLLEV